MELQKGKVRLRPLQLADAERLAELADNVKVWENVRDAFPHPYSIEDARTFIKLMSDEDKAEKVFAIEYAGAFAGACGLHPQPDVYRFSAEVGYWLGEPYWGKGITTTAVRLLTRFGFEQMGMQRLYAGVFEYNKASMRVLEKCGYELEAVLKKRVFKKEAFWDEYLYAKVKG